MGLKFQRDSLMRFVEYVNTAILCRIMIRYRWHGAGMENGMNYAIGALFLAAASGWLVESACKLLGI